MQRKNSNLRSIVAISLVTAFCLAGDSMLYIALPLYRHQVGLMSLWEVGVILSVNRFVRLPLNPLVGMLYTRVPIRIGLIAAVLLTAVATFGYGLLEGFWPWLVLRCIWGFAWSILKLGGMFSVVALADDANRGQVMGIHNGLYRLGSLVGMLLGGALTGIYGLKFVAIGFGALALLGLPLIVLFVGSPDRTGRTVVGGKMSVRASIAALLRRSAATRNVLLGGLTVTLVYQGVFVSTLSYVIDHHYSGTVRLFGGAVAAAALAGYLQAARWLWEPFLAAGIGRWSDGPRGRLPLFFASLFLAAICLCLIPVPLPVPVWIAVVLLCLATATAVTTLMDTLAADAAKGSRAGSVALMTAYTIALDLGAALGPFLAYLLLDLQHGMAYAYIGSAALLLLLIRRKYA
jgi:MFS family permease